MGKRSKGFGDLLRQERSKAKDPTGAVSKLTVLKKKEDIEPYFESSCEEQEERVGAIIGLDKDGEVPSVKTETLAIYRSYLEKNLEFPCLVTGKEDFHWEEYYIIGPGSKKEHQRLRKTKPSYLDTYELLGFENRVQDEFYGLLVNVKRTSDKKKFDLPLSDLKATSKETENSQLLDDYSFWFVNWR